MTLSDLSIPPTLSLLPFPSSSARPPSTRLFRLNHEESISQQHRWMQGKGFQLQATPGRQVSCGRKCEPACYNLRVEWRRNGRSSSKCHGGAPWHVVPVTAVQSNKIDSPFNRFMSGRINREMRNGDESSVDGCWSPPGSGSFNGRVVKVDECDKSAPLFEVTLFFPSCRRFNLHRW